MLITAFGAWFINYLAPLLVAFMVAGAILEIMDRYIGVPVYRWYHNRGVPPEQRLHADREIGFFYGRSLRQQHNRALLLSAIQSVLAVSFGNYSSWEIVAEVPTLFLEGWFLIPGLWLGDKIFVHVIKRQDKIFDAIDHREETVKNLFSWALDLPSKFRNFIPATKPAVQPQPSAPEVPQPPQKLAEDMSAKAVLQRFAEGRKP